MLGSWVCSPVTVPFMGSRHPGLGGPGTTGAKVREGRGVAGNLEWSGQIHILSPPPNTVWSEQLPKGRGDQEFSGAGRILRRHRHLIGDPGVRQAARTKGELLHRNGTCRRHLGEVSQQRESAGPSGEEEDRREPRFYLFCHHCRREWRSGSVSSLFLSFFLSV